MCGIRELAVNISLGGRCSAIMVKVGEKTEKYSPAELPDSGSFAVVDELLAFQYEFNAPSCGSLLKYAEQLHFLVCSALLGSADEENAYSLLETFSRYRGENPHIVGAIGSAAELIAGHLYASSARLA
jgi:hypothetical protein